MDSPRLPAVDSTVTVLDGTRSFETHVAGIQGKMVLIPRPETPPSAPQVLVRWLDPETRRPMEAEALPSPSGRQFLGLALTQTPRMERRAHRRYPAPRGVTVDVKVRSGKQAGTAIRGRVVDVSAGGIAFRSRTALEVGSEVEVTVRALGGEAYLRGRRCRIASARAGEDGCIVGLDLRDQASGERGLASLVEEAVLAAPHAA